MLKYVGDGRFLIGIPARDLSDEEVKSLEISERGLVKTGLYKAMKSKKEDGNGDNSTS